MIYPERIDAAESQGEKILHEHFKSDPRFGDVFILHSLFLQRHIKHISGEIDFLVLMPDHGIFIIELKHGGIERNGSTWIYTNGKGHITKKNRSPFRQASDALHSLKRWIIENSTDQKGLRIKKMLFGTGVVFSSLREFVDVGIEGEQWQILYGDRIANKGLFNYLVSLSNKWHIKEKSKGYYNSAKSRPSKEHCQYILKLIRGDFKHDYSLLNKLIDNKNEIKKLTNEQFEKYNHILYNNRNLLEGLAGTGKTILAYILALELIKNGSRIAFICYNRNLGTKFRNDFKDIDKNSFFGSYHSFLFNNIRTNNREDETEKEFYDKMPTQFLLQNEEFEKFDYLIVDEAQDLVSSRNLFVFDHILKGGLKAGAWTCCGDFEKQSIYNNEKGIDLLLKYGPAQYKPLNINCRNTIDIMEENIHLTKVQYEKCINIMSGDSLYLRFENIETQIKLLDEELGKLFDANISPNQISILSPNKYFREEIISRSVYPELFEIQTSVFHTIQSFKGLENDFIFLVGFESLKTKEQNQLLYIGISRASYKLYMIFDTDLKSEYIELRKG